MKNRRISGIFARFQPNLGGYLSVAKHAFIDKEVFIYFWQVIYDAHLCINRMQTVVFYMFFSDFFVRSGLIVLWGHWHKNADFQNSPNGVP